jgi:predicted RNA-binding protein with PUA-like domain
MQYWLMKSEPDEVSIDDVMASPKQTTAWFGVRNYQARNFMRDQMQVAMVCCSTTPAARSPALPAWRDSERPYPDASQFDSKSKYYDAKATQESRAGFRLMCKARRKRAVVAGGNAHHPRWKTWWCCRRAAACPSRRSRRRNGSHRQALK